MRLGSRIRLGEGDVAARGKAVAALGARLCFDDEAGFSMTPPTARTWARRGDTPVIRVRGRSQRRFFIAALASYKPGERSRLIYRPKRHVDHKHGGRRSFTWTDYRDLLTAAHQQLGAPIVLVLDILNVHRDRRLREFIDTDDWITCYFLPAYTPDLNPVEGIWSLLRRSSQANTAFTDPDHLMRSLRHNYAKWEADGTTQQVHDLLRDVDWQTSRHGGRARRASPRHPPALHDPVMVIVLLGMWWGFLKVMPFITVGVILAEANVRPTVGRSRATPAAPAGGTWHRPLTHLPGRIRSGEVWASGRSQQVTSTARTSRPSAARGSGTSASPAAAGRYRCVHEPPPHRALHGRGGVSHERQLGQRPHRPVAAQNSISQLEQRVRTRSQTGVELAPEA
jgi:hypothetical protein